MTDCVGCKKWRWTTGAELSTVVLCPWVIHSRLVSLGQAIERELVGERNKSWLARELNVHPSTISRLVAGETHDVTLAMVARIEHCLGLSTGQLLRAGGFVEADPSALEDAIARDPWLSRAEKVALSGSLEAFRSQHTAERRRRGRTGRAGPQ